MSTEIQQIKTPVAWQKFGRDWCLTGQHGMRPIYLSAGRSGCLQLLDARNILIPFTPDHPHAKQIERAVNMHEDMVDKLSRLCDSASIMRERFAVNGPGDGLCEQDVDQRIKDARVVLARLAPY